MNDESRSVAKKAATRMTAAAAKIRCRNDRCAVARPSMESPRDAIPTCRSMKEIGVVYSMSRRPSRTTSFAVVSPNVPSSPREGTERYGFPFSVTRSWATTMSEASRMAMKAMSGSLALVFETSVSSPSGSFASIECPAERDTTREIEAPRWSRSRRRVDFVTSVTIKVTETIRRKTRGSRNPNSFRRIPTPTRRSIPPGPVVFSSASMAITYTYYIIRDANRFVGCILA